MKDTESSDVQRRLKAPPHFQVDRRSFDLDYFNSTYQATGSTGKPATKHVQEAVRSCCTVRTAVSVITTLFPVIRWLGRYNYRRDLLRDLIAGMTVIILQVPQGMAYSQLAGVSPVYGLYASFFPVLIYTMMGTSRHLCLGTYSVLALMTNDIIMKYTREYLITSADNSWNIDGNDTIKVLLTEEHRHPHEMEIAMVLCLLMGIYQLLLGVFRLGSLNVFLSHQLISGFTTGAAVYVVTSQLNTLLGYDVSAPGGVLNLVYRYIAVFSKIHETNCTVLGLSTATIFTLVLFKEAFGPRIQKLIRVPFPIELFVVIIGILVCTYLELDTTQDVAIVGVIPTGLPVPTLPNPNMLGRLAVDSIGLTFVGIASALSMGRIYARKNNYQIDCNQELIALGSSSLFSGFFYCIPSTASISMTAVQEGSGGQTQLVSIISCFGVLMVLLFLAPLLNKLPQCILSAIIVVSLKGLLFQVKDLKYYWKISKLDALIWLVTFLAVIFLNVDLGLAVGVSFSVVVLLWRSNRPKTALLGEVPGTNVYVPIKKYLTAVEEPGLKIFQFNGPLHFANIDYFRYEMIRRTGISPSNLKRKREEKLNKIDNPDDMSSKSDLKEAIENGKGSYSNDNKINLEGGVPVSLIILDCTGVSYVDAPGAAALKETVQEHKEVGVDFYIAACSPPVYETLKKVTFFEVNPSHTFFPTVHDAVLHARNGILRPQPFNGTTAIVVNKT